MFTAASYTPFFKECWDRKNDTEAAFSFSELGHTALPIAVADKLGMRPPATLPKPPVRKDSVGINKGSTSNR